MTIRATKVMWGRDGDLAAPEFRCLREVHGRLRGASSDLGSALVDCQRGMPPRQGEECRDCTHLVDWAAGSGPGELILHCEVDHHDSVSGLMTGARALVHLPAGKTADEALRLAQEHDLRHLVVTEGERDDQLRGVVCRCDLYPALGSPARVGDLVRRPVVGVLFGETLGDAVARMKTFQVGLLPVVAFGLLVGVISRGDLRRAGVADEILAGPRCDVCGAGARACRYGGAAFCYRCVEEGRARPELVGLAAPAADLAVAADRRA